MPILTAPAERLTGLLSYLEQYEKLRRSVPFTIPDEYFCAFRSEIEGLPGLSFNQVHAGDDVWLSLPRLGELPPPEPSAALLPWVAYASSADEQPRLRSEIVRKAGEEETRLALSAFPGLAKLFAAYLEQQWTPWALEERPRRRAISLYNRLFALHRRMQAESVALPLELCWGMGIAVWKPEGGRGSVKFPLITQSCELTLDEETLELAVRPREVVPSIELAPYAELETPGVAALEAIWLEHLKQSEQRPSPFTAPSTASVCQAAVGYLDPAGRYDDTLGGTPVPEPGENLLVTDSWVLFARRRPDRVWADDLRRLKRQLKKAPVVATAAARLADGGAGGPRAASVPLRGACNPGAAGAELYFPLPYNDAQRLVAEHLDAADGVVIEAPPGTGTAQTAANLICRCLARGQRVLVVSPSDAPLRRVQQRVPLELRPLTVAILSDERRGMRQVAHSIASITERLKSIEPAQLEREVAAQEQRIAELHDAIAAADQKLLAFGAPQLAPLSVDGTEHSPTELARLLSAQAGEYGWLTDPLDPLTQPAPRVTADDMAALRAARIALGPDIVYFGCRLPDPAALPDEAAVRALHGELFRARRLESQVSRGALLPLLDDSPATRERAVKLRELLRREDALRAETGKDPYGWANGLRIRFEAREDQVARELIIAARSIAVEELARKARHSVPVEVPPEAELSEDVVEAVARRASGKLGGLLPVGKKETRAALEAMLVDGAKPDGAESWARVAAELEHRAKARKLIAHWNKVASDSRLEPVKDSGPRGFRELAARADYVLRMHELITRVEAPIRTALPSVFSAATLRSLPGSEEVSHKAIAESLASHLDRDQLSGAGTRLRDVLRSLEGYSGPVVDRMWHFLTGELGKGESPDGAAANGNTWGELLAELRRATELEPLLASVARVTAAIEASGAATWAERLRTLPADRDNDPQTPPGWREAWRWRIGVMLLGALDGHDVLRQLLQRRRLAESDLVKASRLLVADRAWLAVHRHSPERVRQAMREYSHSLRALSAGEGVRSSRNREISAAALARARSAVPCWLLPLWRVPEAVAAEIGEFDVVIVTDASRVDLTALGALLRGKKLVVLGDRQQLPPPASGIGERKLKELAARFLKDQPLIGELAPGRSLLDWARDAFGGVLAFREHFGAAPEIVAYANREFYGGELVPLRAPTARQRLEPPLVDVMIEGAQRDGDLNEAEAHAAVEEVEAALASDGLAGHSIGVVSLLGEEQAQRIERLLRQRVALRAIIDRRITVGTPDALEGDARSLVIVSLGLAANDRGGATSAALPQWFNVAATRATDRLVLLRSIPESELAADSDAARLVRHFREPFHGAAPDVRPARERCETELERELLDALVARGFRVSPRRAIGPLVIDLVVEGEDDRNLAIACDGDRAPGTEDWAAELARQRTLERVGWTVWRCFEAHLVLRREHVLGDLWATLDRLGIDAIGPAPESRAASSARRVQHAAPVALLTPIGVRDPGAVSKSRSRRRPRAAR